MPGTSIFTGEFSKEPCLLLTEYTAESPGFQKLAGRSTLTENHCGHAKRMHWSTEPMLAVPSCRCMLTVCVPGAGTALPAQPRPGCGEPSPPCCGCDAGWPHCLLCLRRTVRSLQLKSKPKFHFEPLCQINMSSNCASCYNHFGLRITGLS